MKLGSMIFVIIVLVFSIGFLFSNNLDADTEGLHKKVADLQSEILALQTKNRNLANSLAQEQTANTKAQARSQELLTKIETLASQHENALAQLAQTQQDLERVQALCAQTSSCATGLATLTGQGDLHSLAETASTPGLIVLFLALTTATGVSWYCWRHFRRSTSSLTPQSQPGELWVRMTRQQASQFVRSQRQIRNNKS